MVSKQLDLRETIERIAASKCIKCGGPLGKPICHKWKIPLCRDCRLEVMEDMDIENSSLRNETKTI